MGSRDIRKKETKKPRKDSKKTPQVNISAPPAPVEVIGKGKRREREEE